MSRERCPGTGLVAPLAVALVAGCGDAAPVTSPPAEPSAVVVLSGEGQRAVPGGPLPEPVVVRVLDGGGQTVAGAVVSFLPAPGSGTADPASTTTSGNGEAATMWTLGTAPGHQTLAVSASTAVETVGAEAIDVDAALDSLFAPPTAAEVEAIRADWAHRDVSAAGVSVEHSEALALGGSSATLRIVSHTVAGVRHFGAIIVPDGAAAGSLPVFVYAHGGDSGVSVNDIQIVALSLGELRDRWVYVIPSFRGEPLGYGDRVWVSDGPPGPWDYDVDDVLALVNVAFESTPEARPGAYTILGGSRGAAVALLAAIRDERIEGVVAFFGPTDFFDPWVRSVAREAALGRPGDLPGVAHLDSTFITPYVRGEVGLPAARLEIVRRSAVLFAEDLPAVQLHHGTRDLTVPVTQAESLIRTMTALGRTPPDFEAFIYEGGGHDFLSLAGAIPRAVEFIARTLPGEGTSRR